MMNDPFLLAAVAVALFALLVISYRAGQSYWEYRARKRDEALAASLRKTGAQPKVEIRDTMVRSYRFFVIMGGVRYGMSKIEFEALDVYSRLQGASVFDVTLTRGVRQSDKTLSQIVESTRLSVINTLPGGETEDKSVYEFLVTVIAENQSVVRSMLVKASVRNLRLGYAPLDTLSNDVWTETALFECATVDVTSP